MATVILPASITANVRTFNILDQMVAVLGSVRTTIWPFLESVDSEIRSYGESVHALTSSDGAARLLEAEFSPVQHPGGIHSYHIVRADNNHLAGLDDDDFSPVVAAVDVAFSVGAWILPTLAGTQQTLLAKFDVAGTLREWQLGLSAAELINFELFDESIADANASVAAPGVTTLPLNEWAFVVATYGGQGGNPGFAGSAMSLAVYLNGRDDTGTVAGSGADAYVDMENTATPLMVGAADDTAAPTFELDGRIALPFFCGRELSSTQVSELHSLGRRLLGL